VLDSLSDIQILKVPGPETKQNCVGFELKINLNKYPQIKSKSEDRY